MDDFFKRAESAGVGIFHTDGEIGFSMQASVIAAQVFGGDRFFELLGRVPIYAAEYSCCAIDEDGSPLLAFRAVDLARPEIVVHEVAHAFHALFLPDLTKRASDDLCEAVAGVAELRLAYLHPHMRSTVENRLKLFKPGARERIEAHRREVDMDFLILAQHILEDCYHGA